MSMSRPELLQHIKAVLFDKDGTLIDYDQTWAKINLRVVRMAAAGDEARAVLMCEKGGIDPATGSSLPDSLFGSGNTVEIAEMLYTNGCPVPRDKLVFDIDTVFQSGADSSVPLADLGKVFRALTAAGFVLGIASNDSETGVLKTMEALNVVDQISFACGYDSGHGAKPSAGMVRAFSASIGTDTSQVAVVGDSRHDMEMARAAGSIAIGVLSGTGTRRSLDGYCDAMLNNVGELPDLFGRMS